MTMHEVKGYQDTYASFRRTRSPVMGGRSAISGTPRYVERRVSQSFTVPIYLTTYSSKIRGRAGKDMQFPSSTVDTINIRILTSQF